MVHRRGIGVLLGGVSVMLSVFLVFLVGSAWALPHHAYDTGWGKGSWHDKDDYEKSYDYGDPGDHKKHGKKGKFTSYMSGWGDLDWGKSQKHKGYDHDDFVKWGKGYGKDEPDWGKSHKHKGWGDHDYVKWGKGYGKDDPDCDPPVSTPEPATLLLLGSTLAGLGVYARRRKPPAGE